jgi:hypothetical protein
MMKIQISSLSILFLAGLFSISTLVGCGGSGSNAPVSGVVTLDGNPLSGIRVTFYPEPATGNSAPGPYSTAVTDSEGKFSLVDRYDSPGAMVWKHKVEFEWDEVDEAAISDAMEGADGDGSADRTAVNAANAQQKKFPKIPKNYENGGARQFVVDVPAGGLESYSLEMMSK